MQTTFILQREATSQPPRVLFCQQPTGTSTSSQPCVWPSHAWLQTQEWGCSKEAVQYAPTGWGLPAEHSGCFKLPLSAATPLGLPRYLGSRGMWCPRYTSAPLPRPHGGLLCFPWCGDSDREGGIASFPASSCDGKPPWGWASAGRADLGGEEHSLFLISQLTESLRSWKIVFKSSRR